MNIHQFDGKLDLTLTPKILEIYLLPVSEKIRLGVELLDACNFFSQQAFHNLKILVDSIGTISNIDTTHNIIIPDKNYIHLSVDDCICLCNLYKYNKDFLCELEIQLIDMSTGMCPQGRTHRLLQILNAWSS